MRAQDRDWIAFLDSIVQADTDLQPPLPPAPSRTCAQYSSTISHGQDDAECSSQTASAFASGSADACISNQIVRKRQNQKKFRIRVKERNESMRSVLAHTQWRLQQSETERNSLLSQNQLLTRLLQHESPNAGMRAESFAMEAGNTFTHVPRVIQHLILPAMKLMSWTKRGPIMTPHDIASLPWAQFSCIYTATIEQMKAILSTSMDASDKDRQQQLCGRVLDITRLRFALFAIKPSRILSLGRASLDTDGSSPAQHCIPTQVVQGLVGMSESQLRDLLALRHLFFRQLGRLSQARNALLQQLTTCRQLPKLRALAGQLQQSVDDEHEAHLKMLTACCLGIPTPTQAAVGMIASYPSMLYLPFMEKLAHRFGEPSLSDIVNQVAECNHDGPLSWGHVEAYVETITVDTMFTSIPFLAKSHQQQLCSA